MSRQQPFWFLSFLSDEKNKRRGVQECSRSDSSDSCDQPAEVCYDHQWSLPLHDPAAHVTVVRRNDGQPPSFQPDVGDKQSWHSTAKQISTTFPTSSLDNGHKSSTDTFPVSTLASTVPTVTPSASPPSKSAVSNYVDADVVTMDHAVRVPSALLSAGRRTMFDILVDIAAQEREHRVRQAKGRESTHNKKNVCADKAVAEEAPSRDTTASARDITYQMLFLPGASAAAPAPPPIDGAVTTRASITDATAVKPLFPGEVKENLMSSVSTPNLRTLASSSRPPEPVKPDRRLRHLLPAHLRGDSSTLQGTDDDSHGRRRQTVEQSVSAQQQFQRVSHRSGAAGLDVSDISSVSSWSDEDNTENLNTRHLPPPNRKTQTTTDASAAAPPPNPQRSPPATCSTGLSGRVDKITKQIASMKHRHDACELVQSDRPQGEIKDSEKKWAQMEWVLTGVMRAAASPPTGKRRCVTDRHRDRSLHPGARETIPIPSSRRNRRHSTITGRPQADSAEDSSDTDDSVHRGRGGVDLCSELEDDVPRWARQHQATHERLEELQGRQRKRSSRFSPTFYDTHMSFIEKAAATDKARMQQALATTAPLHAFIGKPYFFCPSSTTTRTRNVSSHTSRWSADTDAVGSTSSCAGGRKLSTQSAPTADSMATGASRSLAGVWKEGKRLLQQRSSNATAVSVVEYLWQCFQAWKPYGLRLLRHLRSGTNIGEASASPVRDDAAEDVSDTVEHISCTSSDSQHDGKAVFMENVRVQRRKHGKKGATLRPPSQRSPVCTIAVDETGIMQARGTHIKGSLKTCAATSAETVGDCNEGIELQVKVHYMESAFNVVTVQGDITYASKSACARMGLEFPLPTVNRSSVHVSGGAEDSAAIPTSPLQGWTILVPEPALMEVPMILEEHLYLAPPYTVFREVRALLSSYNFTTDALLRQYAVEKEALQGERHRRTALNTRNLEDVAVTKAGAPSKMATVETRAAVNTVLGGHTLDSGCGDSSSDQRVDIPAIREIPFEDASSREAAPCCWASPKKKQETPRREASGAHAGTSAPATGTPVMDRTPTAARQSDGDPTGASPDPHPPLPRCPQHRKVQPPSGVASGMDMANIKSPSRRCTSPEPSSVSPSYVRASTAGADLLSVEGFYDPLAMSALPLTGTNERWSGSRGGGTSGSAPNISDETTILAQERVCSSRILPIPPPITSHLSERHLPHRANDKPAENLGGVDTDDHGARSNGTLVTAISSVAATGTWVSPKMSDPIGDGFPRGPTADWDVPVEVLFVLSGGVRGLEVEAQDRVRYACQRRDVEVDQCSEEFESVEAPTHQRGIPTRGSIGTISSEHTPQPAHVLRRHRQETRTSADNPTVDSPSRESSGFDTPTASQMTPSGISLRITSSSRRSRSGSLSSLSEPENEHDNELGISSGLPYASCVPRRKLGITNTASRPRHGSYRSGLRGSIATSEQQQRWMRDLWGRGEEHELPVSSATCPTVAAWTHAPTDPLQCNKPPQQTRKPLGTSTMHSSKSLLIIGDAVTSAPRLLTASSITANMAEGGVGDHNAANPTRLPFLSTENVSAHEFSGAPVLPHTEDAEASTSTTKCFAIEEVCLSDTD